MIRKRVVLGFFERLNSPKVFVVVLTLVVAVNLCSLFFGFLPKLAEEQRSTQATAVQDELIGGGPHPALKPPVGPPEDLPVKAELSTEVTREGTNASAREESPGPPRRSQAHASRPAAASLKEVTNGSLFAAPASSASTAQYYAASASVASTAQYGSAAAVQYATADASPGSASSHVRLTRNVLRPLGAVR